MADSKSRSPGRPDPEGDRKLKNVREQLLEEVKTDGAEAALDWIKSRWRIYAALAAACIVAVLVASAWTSLADSREQKGQAALPACTKAVDASTDEAASGIAACDAVVTEHRGTSAAAQAQLVKGALLVRSGRAAEAAELLVGLATEIPKSSPFVGVVRLALARAQEAAGKPADAVATYKALQADGFTADEATTFDLARVLEASGKRDDAKKLIEDEIAKAGNGPEAGPQTSRLRARLALFSAPAPAVAQAAEPVKN